MMSLLPLLVWFLRYLVAGLNGRQAGRQAAPTCYMDRSKDHRISLDRSNSFLHPSCPYWFGPFPPRCAPVALIKTQVIYPPQNEARKERGRRAEREKTKERRQQLQTHCDERKSNKTKKEKLDATTYVKNLRGTSSVPTCYMDIWKAHSISLNLLNFSRLPSCLGWYGSCLLQHDRVALVRTKMTVVEWISLTKIWEMMSSNWGLYLCICVFSGV